MNWQVVIHETLKKTSDLLFERTEHFKVQIIKLERFKNTLNWARSQSYNPDSYKEIFSLIDSKIKGVRMEEVYPLVVIAQKYNLEDVKLEISLKDYETRMGFFVRRLFLTIMLIEVKKTIAFLEDLVIREQRLAAAEHRGKIDLQFKKRRNISRD